MKKINYKKVMVAVLWIGVISAITVSLGFVAKSERDIIATSMNITIHNNEENPFLTENDVRDLFKEGENGIISNHYRDINIPQIERTLNAHPAIENADVSATLNGEVRIDITQRTPVLRVLNKDGESYYIDSHTKLMPLNDNYSARVLIASGEIFEPYARRYNYSVDQISNNKLFSEVSILDDLMEVTKFINSDSTLAGLIHQIYVNHDRELELFPSIGNHRIIFGNTVNVAEKFNKLKLFYSQGLNKADSWNKYSTINLKYKNLVVCTKK